MAATYYYTTTAGGSIAPPTSPWQVTTAVSDGSAGDTGTGVTASDSLTYGPGCGYKDVVALIEVCAAYSCPVSLSALTFYYSTTNLVTNPESTCILGGGDPLPAGFDYTLGGRYSLDGLSWTNFTPTDNTTNGTKTFADVSVKYVVVWVEASYELYDENDTIQTTATITDFRLTTVDLPPLTAPTLSAQGDCEDGQNTLSWSAVPCATSYDIERDGGVIVTGVTETTYVDSPVNLEQEYSYRVRGVNAAGAGPWGSAVLFTPCAADGGGGGEETGCGCTWTRKAGGSCTYTRRAATANSAVRRAATAGDWTRREC